MTSLTICIGNGVTELIAACAFNDSTNGVGRFSFTHALIGQLTKLVSMPSFTVGYLYNLLFAEIQGWRKEDTRHKKAPVHLVLTQDHRLPRSIKIYSKTSSLGGRVLQTAEALSREANPWDVLFPWYQQESSLESTPAADNVISPFSSDAASSMTSISAIPEYPRLLFSIRISENIKPRELSTELFADWLGTLPIATTSVRVEAGFASDSTLLMVSMPVGLLGYLPDDPAITMLGITRSINLLTMGEDTARPQEAKDAAAEKGSPSNSEKMRRGNPMSMCEFVYQFQPREGMQCFCNGFVQDQLEADGICECGHLGFIHVLDIGNSSSKERKVHVPEEQVSHWQQEFFEREKSAEKETYKILALGYMADENEAEINVGARHIRSPSSKGKAVESPIQEEFSGHSLRDKFEAFAKTPWSDDEEDDSNIKIKVKQDCTQCAHNNVNSPRICVLYN